MAQNFYLSGFSTNVNVGQAATFFSVVNPENFTDYSANVICRMRTSVAQNMFQFWSRSADISLNSLADLAFRLMYDPSGGFAEIDASANPLSLDFTLGSIVTWSDPSYLPIGKPSIDTFTINGTAYQTLLPQNYLRYLSWLIFQNANLTSNFLNPVPVMSSINTSCKEALNITLKTMTAYDYGSNNNNNNVGRQYDYLNRQVTPFTFSVNPNITVPDASNASSRIFQQIRTNAISRIDNYNPVTGKINNTTDSNGNVNGAWYKMPFVSGDSIYFILTINVPSEQKDSGGQNNLTIKPPRRYRFRMYIMDDNQLQLSDGTNPITYGDFNVYPTANSLVKQGYSYANTLQQPLILAGFDTKPPGPPNV